MHRRETKLRNKIRRTKRNVNAAGHAFGAFLIEGLGIAVLAFLFLITQLSPTDSEQLSVQEYFKQIVSVSVDTN